MKAAPTKKAATLAETTHARDIEKVENLSWVFHSEDFLCSVVAFLDWKELCVMDLVSKMTAVCARKAWQWHAQNLSLGRLQEEDAMTPKDAVVAFTRSKLLAEQTERLWHTHMPVSDDESESSACSGCIQMPSMLSVDAVFRPSHYLFFVRIAQRTEDETHHLFWQGFLPFQIDDEKPHLMPTCRRCITCNVHQVLGSEVYDKWQSLNELLGRGLSYDDFAIQEDFLLLENLAITVTVYPKRNAQVPVGGPRLLITAGEVMETCGDLDEFDGRVEWTLNFQNVATHDHSARGIFGAMCLSWFTENRQLTDLDVLYFVQ